MKKDDLRPYLQVKLFNPDGTARNVSGDVVTFVMEDTDGTNKINAAATQVNGAGGIVEYRWQVGDTDTAGEFRAEFTINGIDTFPKEGYIVVSIIDDLN